ncbi:alpha/beta fold hydrolase [Oceanicella actignis]|uniref:alpha/beta fold hydrolase n=1 Tax=Oceanicella actignis TaxID=1189325 RepID=UPI00125191B0|nr:alpha/beta fold hydrolase [Oceanicella actignis]TYO88146.1 polyhydroxyalkanoate synthase [Oceanicella actignis]
MAPLGDDPRFPWAPELADEGRAAAAALRRAAGAEATLHTARAAARRLAEFVAGVERYQKHPWRRRLPDPPCVWRRGATRLLDHGGDGRPALIVPSLVNRAHVLDLHPDRSLLRWLSRHGVRPLLLDWGAPGPEEMGFDLADHVMRRLVPAAEAAAEMFGAPPAVAGYCMGGGLAAALAATRPELTARLALIGTPWDFSRLEGMGAALAAAFAREDRAALRARIEGLRACFGAVPMDVLQTLFAALDPTLALRKFRKLARMPRGDPAEELFVAAEDWLNDGPPLPAPAAADLLLGWCLDNDAARGSWQVGGRAVRPEDIAAPTLAFCATRDLISPPGCAEALPRAIPGARILRPQAGHVGMIIGAQAPRMVWSPLAAFLAEGG